MWIGIISLFPEMFKTIIDFGVVGRAVKKGLLTVETWNPRDFTTDKHKSVDDRPYGGGPGMLMMVQPLQDAIKAAKQQAGDGVRTIYLSPQGEPLKHNKVLELTKYDKVILLCGRYEGIDERLIKAEVDLEISIGDYVLSGGELPAMVLIDAMARFIPGVLGKQESALQDSFVSGLLDCPHYTRPEILNGEIVPPILMSGHHEEIRKWRLQKSLERTLERRPELLEDLALTDEQELLLKKIKQQN